MCNSLPSKSQQNDHSFNKMTPSAFFKMLICSKLVICLIYMCIFFFDYRPIWRITRYDVTPDMTSDMTYHQKKEITCFVVIEYIWDRSVWTYDAHFTLCVCVCVHDSECVCIFFTIFFRNMSRGDKVPVFFGGWVWYLFLRMSECVFLWSRELSLRWWWTFCIVTCWNVFLQRFIT